jgi:hypothetical protein
VSGFDVGLGRIRSGQISSPTDEAQAKADSVERLSADTFLKRLDAWAFNAHFLSTLNDPSEVPGRFSVAPVDGLVMSYLESHVPPSNRLPTGHMYDIALDQAFESLQSLVEGKLADKALAVIELLDRDRELRDFMTTRRLEHFFS